MVHRSLRFILPFVLLFGMLAACKGAAIPPVTDPQISRHPAPWGTNVFNRGPITTLPTVDPTTMDPFSVDFRSADLAQLDLSKSLDLLSVADFDSQTKWPSAKMLPKVFWLSRN